MYMSEALRGRKSQVFLISVQAHGRRHVGDASQGRGYGWVTAPATGRRDSGIRGKTRVFWAVCISHSRQYDVKIFSFFFFYRSEANLHSLEENLVQTKRHASSAASPEAVSSQPWQRRPFPGGIAVRAAEQGGGMEDGSPGARTGSREPGPVATSAAPIWQPEWSRVAVRKGKSQK